MKIDRTEGNIEIYGEDEGIV